MVTGASGFLGLPVALGLEARGYSVIGVQRDSSIGMSGIRLVATDLMDPNQVRSVFRDIKPEVLVHCAWCTDHGTFWRSSQNVSWIVSSMLMLEEFAANGGKRVVGIGSCAEYDWAVPGPYTEDSKLNPATLYGAAKASLGMSLQMLGKHLGIEVAWARIFYPYGPREDSRRLIPALMRAAMTGTTVQVREPESWIDPIRADDVADAICQIAASDVIGSVNVAGGDALTIRQLVSKIEHITEARGIADLKQGEGSVVTADLARLRTVGFSPSATLNEGLASFYDSLRSGG